MPELIVTDVTPAAASEPSVVVSSSQEVPSLREVLSSELKEAKAAAVDSTPVDADKKESVVPEKPFVTTTEKPDIEARPQPQKPVQEESPFGALKPEYLGRLQEYYAGGQQKSTQEPKPATKSYQSVLDQYGIGGEFKDEGELISRLAAGYRLADNEKRQLTSALQHLSTQVKQLEDQQKTQLKPKDDLGELSWTDSYDSSWDSILVEDPVTKEVSYRAGTTPEQQRAFAEWHAKREGTWKKWTNDPRAMAKDISKFIDQEMVKRVAEEVTRQQVTQYKQVDEQEKFLRDYLTRNQAVFYTSSPTGQAVPSAWAEHMHRLLLPRSQQGHGLPLQEAVTQFERDYALAHYMSRQAAVPQATPMIPQTIGTGIPDLTLEQAAATATANRVVSPKEKSDGKTSLRDIFSDQLRRAGVSV